MSALKDKIIACLKENGADLVGFSGVDRFADKRPQKIFPETKTVIGIAFRILRGSHRGTEEGTTYYQYSTTGIETLEETVMPMAMLKACAILEDHGFAGLPQKRNQTIMAEENSTNPEMDYEAIYRGISAENQLNFEESSVLCGLGEIGLHGSLLTEDFGPMQRYCFILTDAEFEETPVAERCLCDKCGECISACPGKAISAKGKKDNWQCAAYYKGANMTKNPFMPAEAFADDQERLAIITGEAKLSPERAREIIDQIIFYPPIKQGYVSSICGKACETACYVHLERKGILKKKFNTEFRKRKEWTLSVL
jgi:epoxyqueuosine reductase QueG